MFYDRRWGILLEWNYKSAKCCWRRLIRSLVVFEKQFSLSSAEAWKKYSAGELGDRMDLMEWMAVYQNRLSIQKNVQQLNQTIES